MTHDHIAKVAKVAHEVNRQLPVARQAKDFSFRAIVHTLLGLEVPGPLGEAGS